MSILRTLLFARPRLAAAPEPGPVRTREHALRSTLNIRLFASLLMPSSLMAHPADFFLPSYTNLFFF